MKIKVSNLIIILSLAIYRTCLDFVYNGYLIDLFGYYGFKGENSLVHYLLSWIVLISTFLLLRGMLNGKIKIINIVFIFLYLVSFVPFTSMLAFDALSNEYYVYNIIYWFLLFIFYKVVVHIRILPSKRLTKNLSGMLIWAIGFISLSIVLFISWGYTGFRLTFDLLNVYSIRGDVINNLPTFVQYLYSASSAINPLLLIFSLNNKNYLFSVFIIIVQLLSFGINGSKSVFFMTILTIVVYFVLEKNILRTITELITSLSVISILELLLLKSSYLIDFIIRRVMFLPNLISFHYYVFFTSHTPDYFKQSLLSNLGFYSDYGRIPVIIGETYFNNGETAANGGLISDAFQNLGLAGVFIFPAILMLFLKLLDEMAEYLNSKILVVVALYLSNVLISSTLTTSLMTHGLLAVMFVLYILPREINKNEDYISEKIK